MGRHLKIFTKFTHSVHGVIFIINLYVPGKSHENYSNKTSKKNKYQLNNKVSELLKQKQEKEKEQTQEERNDPVYKIDTGLGYDMEDSLVESESTEDNGEDSNSNDFEDADLKKLADSVQYKELEKLYSSKSPIIKVVIEGRRLWIGTKQKGIILFDIDSKETKKFRIPKRYTRDNRQVDLQAMDYKNGVLVAGGRDGYIYVWKNEEFVTTPLARHTGEITALNLSNEGSKLFSGGDDMMVILWNITDMTYIDRLFGHTSAVFDVVFIGSTKSLSVGGMDRTARSWKVYDEKQLIFGPVESSLDAVCPIDKVQFLTGSNSGKLSHWHMWKRKSKKFIQLTGGITSITSVDSSDLFIVGTDSGSVYFIKIESGKMSVIKEQKYPGIISSIDTLEVDGEIQIAIASSAERSQGRWGHVSVENIIYYTQLSINY